MQYTNDNAECYLDSVEHEREREREAVGRLAVDRGRLG
jgi:hypothetical protein